MPRASRTNALEATAAFFSMACVIAFLLKKQDRTALPEEFSKPLQNFVIS
jgi:hypothetical protein